MGRRTFTRNRRKRSTVLLQQPSAPAFAPSLSSFGLHVHLLLCAMIPPFPYFVLFSCYHPSPPSSSPTHFVLQICPCRCSYYRICYAFRKPASSCLSITVGRPLTTALPSTPLACGQPSNARYSRLFVSTPPPLNCSALLLSIDGGPVGPLSNYCLSHFPPSRYSRMCGERLPGIVGVPVRNKPVSSFHSGHSHPPGVLLDRGSSVVPVFPGLPFTSWSS